MIERLHGFLWLLAFCRAAQLPCPEALSETHFKAWVGLPVCIRFCVIMKWCTCYGAFLVLLGKVIFKAKPQSVNPGF